MKKECVFRAQFAGKRYVIYAVPKPKREGEVVYTTYLNRKRLDIFYWESFEGALGSILMEFPAFSMEHLSELYL